MRGTTAALVANFRGAFPELSESEAQALALRTYRSYARDAIDFLRCANRPAPEALASFDGIEAHGELFHGLLARGRGLILVSGHVGNWEMGSVVLRAQNLPLTALAMREASDTTNRLRRGIRGGLGAETIEVRQSIDTALQIRRRLAANRIVALLMDRHVARDRAPVTFFGRRAYFLRTPALLGYLTQAPLLPCTILRAPDGRYRIIPGRPIHVSRELEREEAVAMAVQAFATELEARIREAPHCWYQFYPFWTAQE
jgi:KDO2-lipid IV(A) lauroyltransferase